MRERILAILAIAVGILAVYTVVFRLRPAREWNDSALRAAEIMTAAAAEAKPTGNKAGVAAGSGVQTQAGGDKKESSGQPTEPEPIVWGSDPFVRDWMLINELAALSLRAITLGGEKPYALINDQILEEGDQIAGKRIVKIEKDRVVLEQGGRTFNLMLGE